MQCPRCQHVNPAAVKFCGECGAPLERPCPACRAANPPVNKFCNECGAPLAAAPPAPRFASPQAYTPRHLAEKILTSRSALEGERKQVTVLFCDLANSVALAERLGPESMHALLSRFFELALAEVHRYEGTINQFLGDGFMGLFGAPVAHEDHAWAAVLAAVAIRRSLGEHHAELGLPAGVEFQVRMGLNTGLVVVGRIGDNLRMDYTAVGDTTNLAARLQEVAEPGVILLAEATRRLVQGYVRVEAVGPVQVKGKPEPVPAYRVVGLGPRRSPLEGLGERPLSRFVGRQRELAALRELLAQAEAGRGQVIGLVGEPGVGKSRLLHEFRQTLAGRRITYLQGRCLSYGGTIPYLPLLDILRQNCGLGETDPPGTIAEKVRFGLQEVGLDPDDSGPYLLHLLGVKEGADRLDELSPEAVKARTFETFRQLALRGSRQRPVVFEVEDLHWIDKTSEEFFVWLAESLGGARILLLVTYRPGYRPPWIEKSYATQIVLQPLGPEESLSVVQSVLQASPLPDALTRLILAKAEGNPFFLEELARAVAERTDRTATLEVPDTIEEVLLARIDRLPDEPKRLLQTASILGREVSLRLLRGIWEGPGPLEDHLRELTRIEFLYEQGGTEEPAYVFKHALIREVARSSLLTSRRRALHAAAGRAIEAFYADRLEEAYSGLAYHYSKSDRADKAVEYLARFAEKAARAYAHAEAAAALEEARAHVERLPAEERDARRLDLVLRQAHSLSFLGRFEETLELLRGEEERLAMQATPALAAAYHFWLGHTYSYLGDHKQAAESAQRAFDEAGRAGDEATMGKAYVVLAQESYWAGRPLHGIARGRRAAELLERAGERWWLGLAHWVVGINYIIIGAFELALDAESRAFAIGEVLDDPRIQSYATWSTGWIHALTGEWEAGIEACRRGLGRSPDPVNTAVAEGHLGYVYLEKGDPAEAIPLLERALAHMRQFGFRRLMGRFTTFLGEAYLLGGQLDRARDLVTEGLEITRDAGYAYGAGWAQHALGRIARAEGRLAEAEGHLRGALETFVAIQARFMAGRTHLALAELARVRGDGEAVSAHLQEAYSLFRIMRVTRYIERTEALAREFNVALSEEATSPYLGVVRRGDGELFQTLEAHLAELNVGQVIWDRRVAERRREPHPTVSERRRQERRHPAPPTWDTIGFFLTP